MRKSAVLCRPLSCDESILVEHPGWRQSGDAFQRVFVSQDASRTLVTITPDKVIQHHLAGNGAEPRLDKFSLREEDLARVPTLRDRLTKLGTLARYRTSSLWEAFAWAIIRLRNNGNAETIFRNLSEHGERVSLRGGGEYAMFPTPAEVLALKNHDLQDVGLERVSRRPLVAAAEAYVQHGDEWCKQPRGVLFHSLQSVPRIGVATARSAVADWTNDWSLYPYADPNLRGYAAAAAPSFDWPDDHAFGPLWQELADGNLSSATLLMLTWGLQQSVDNAAVA